MGARTECLSSLILGLLASSAGAWQTSGDDGSALGPRQYEIRRATSAVEVDGVLDERAWQDALVLELSYEWSPGDNIPPPVRTEFLVTYDAERFYAAWRAFDPNPSQIRAHLMDRDAFQTFIQDDHVVLNLDTFNDENRAFEFRVNALGVQMDAILSENEGIEDFSFDLIWDSAGRLTSDGYVVEMAVPLSQLRFPSTPGPQTWGFDVGRSYPRNVRHRIGAAPVDRNKLCGLCQANKLTGFEGMKQSRNLQVTPTMTAIRTDELSGFPRGDLQTGDEDVEIGLSTRWGVTPNLGLDAALNPDFSQVEADAAQLNVNERFALFFPEKRPFFLEGADLFSTPVQVVFTRTVIDPEWGIKLTGKQKAGAFGILVADDEAGGVLLIPSNQRSDFAFLQDGVSTALVRWRRDLGNGYNLGLVATGREAEDYHNRVYGLDGVFRLNSSNTVRLQALRSDTLYPDAVVAEFGLGARGVDGDAYLLEWAHRTRDWFWTAAFEQREPGFRADAGFVPRVDIREARGMIQRQIWGDEEDFYQQINVGLIGLRTEDHGGQLTDETIDLFANVSGPLQSLLELSVERNKQFFGGTLYEGLDRMQAVIQAQPGGSLRLALAADVGETIDFSNNQPADLFEVNPSVELKLGRHFNMQLDHSLQRLDVEGGELFEVNLSQLRLIYNFGVRSFARAIFQYLDLERDPTLFQAPVSAREQELFTQLLFSYKLNPQTVLFLGYSDNRFGVEEISLTQTDRTFFFKIGYAWIM